jgi:MFS family permease
MLALFLVPCVVGSVMLFALGRGKEHTGPLLTGYYLIAFLFACNPLIVSWIAANVGGQTKRSVMMSLYQAGASTGNIVGPLLFKDKDKPAYKPGLTGVMGIFVASIGLVLILMGLFMAMNKRKEAERVKNGKPAKIHDRSMDHKYVAATPATIDEETGDKGTSALGENAFLDISDFKVRVLEFS